MRRGQPPPECTVGDLRQDELTRAVLFTSTCDVFGDNPYGEQLFAMSPDGTALRQLTHTRGSQRSTARWTSSCRPVRVVSAATVGAGLKPAPTVAAHQSLSACRVVNPVVVHARGRTRITDRDAPAMRHPCRASPPRWCAPV